MIYETFLYIVLYFDLSTLTWVPLLSCLIWTIGISCRLFLKLKLLFKAERHKKKYIYTDEDEQKKKEEEKKLDRTRNILITMHLS